MFFFFFVNKELSCRCDPTKATTIIEYDNLSKQPICGTNQTLIKCPIKYINQTNSNIQTKNVQIYYDDSKNCSCNAKTNLFYKDTYCIAKHLFKDFTNIVNFQPTKLIYKDLQYLNFFCQIMKSTEHCNHLANLCVLTDYNLDKNSPCNLFFITQTAVISNGNDYFHKTTPFLFYRKGKDSTDELTKILDHAYSLDEMDEVSARFIYKIYRNQCFINFCHFRIIK